MAELREGDGVLAHALEVVEVAEVERLLARDATSSVFTPGEEAWARRRSDPERRLAARLAAKRAACALLGGGTREGDVEIVRGEGPPALRLSDLARDRLHALGASRALVSLTHERHHAAAVVLLVREEA